MQQPAPSPVVLSMARAPKSPLDICAELAADCNDLQIANMDMYGDFAMSPEQSWLRR